MRSPKEIWLGSGMAKPWQTVVSSEIFDPACQHALMVLQSEMPTTVPHTGPTDPYVAMDANSRMSGARRLLEILSTLSNPIEDKKPQRPQTLHYE